MSTYNYLDKTGLSIVWDKIKNSISSAINNAASNTAPVAVATTSAVGTSTSYARQDHVHAITLASGDNNGQIKIAGSNVSVKGLGTAAYTSSGTYATAAQGAAANSAYAHASAKGSAFTAGLYKITSNAEGHITAATVVTKADITALGIPGSDTTYSPATVAPQAVATTSSVGTSTYYARADHKHSIVLASGDSNGQIKIAGSNVSVKGLGSAAYTSSDTYATPSSVASMIQFEQGTDTSGNLVVGAIKNKPYSFTESWEEDGQIIEETYNITPVANGIGAFAVGGTAEGDAAIAIGLNAVASGYGAIALGPYSLASGGNAIALNGSNATAGAALAINGAATGLGSIALRGVSSGEFSLSEGYGTHASGNYSHAEGYGSKAIGISSHAQGSSTSAIGNYSHSEGANTIASGQYSHAEGRGSQTNKASAHAEGEYTTASGNAAHSEGSSTTASGNQAHSEGGLTQAIGDFSHSEGYYTFAMHKSQHVFGEYNIADPSSATSDLRGTYIEIVGNGVSGTPSNARTLDWSGNETLAGSLTVNSEVTLQFNTTTNALDFIFA